MFTYTTFLSQARADRQIALHVPSSKQLRHHRTQIQPQRHHIGVSTIQQAWRVWEISSLPFHSQEIRCRHLYRPNFSLSLNHYQRSPMIFGY